jgi:5'-deoxynucleotidase YfbR-like HD superfamily hydrolase
MQEYILTYTKLRFYPLNPKSEDIRIEDIAHALSLMTRANGHFSHFYSVAQHCVNCCKEAANRGYSRRVQLGCLLHDASESYISDITRPVKHHLKAYYAIEDRLQGLIYQRYGLGDLSEGEVALIKAIDDALLFGEFEALMQIRLFEPEPERTMEHDYSQRDFKTVESEFLSLFQALTDNAS